MRLVAPLMAGIALPELAQPHLRRMAQEMGETVNLAILDGTEVLYIASASGSFVLRAETPPGLRIAAHCTALGKCMLAQLTDEAVREQIGPGPYPSRTSKSVRTWPQLASQLEQARVDGYALSLEEYEIGLNSLAVPVPTTNGTSAAINVAALASRVSPDDLITKFAPRLRDTAVAIAHAQGLELDHQ
jgi:DNA-binding IclR family transcriptional regulator